MKPRIYLAGKVHYYDWLHELVPNLRDLVYDDHVTEMLDSSGYPDHDVGDWMFVGPYPLHLLASRLARRCSGGHSRP